MEIENGKDDSEQIEVYNIELLRINVQGIPWWFSGLDLVFTAKGLDSTPGLAEKLRSHKLQAWQKKKKKRIDIQIQAYLILLHLADILFIS